MTLLVMNKHIGLPLCDQILLKQLYDYKPNSTPVGPVIINQNSILKRFAAGEFIQVFLNFKPVISTERYLLTLTALMDVLGFLAMHFSFKRNNTQTAVTNIRNNKRIV